MNEPNRPRDMAADSPIFIDPGRPPRKNQRLLTPLLLVALLCSIMINFIVCMGYFATLSSSFSSPGELRERYHSGDRTADEKIALINVNGTIMPPFTKRILKAIEQVGEDDAVKGIVLVIDSPGGLVADSHQIYHRLQQLKKPIFVAMKRMAASGGYYIAMGAGKEATIFAEPTTWTGSIGVIIPRFDFSKLAEKYGVKADPLKTGPFKDALSPFRELDDAERAIWAEILDESFDRFLNVIAENRPGLDYDAVKLLATGQIYTASQAKENGMIDLIGYEDEVIEALKKKLGLAEARVVSYDSEPGLLELLSGAAKAKQPENQWRMALEATIPQPMYLGSWAPAISSWSSSY